MITNESVANVIGKCGSRGGGAGGSDPPPPPVKNHKNIGFSSNTGPDLLTNCSYQASIQFLAIIGTPAKRHLMALSWRADDGPLKEVLGSSLPSSTKQKEEKKTLSKLDPSDKSFWIRACLVAMSSFMFFLLYQITFNV